MRLFSVVAAGLIGSKGISPAHELMQRVKQRGWTWQTRWRDLPTVFWYSCSDDALRNVQLIGLVASVCAFFGIFSGWSIFVATVCYSSTKSVGSVFTGLQMHAHLMEIDILYTLASPFLHVTPAAFVVLASLLNFRVMFGGGAGKWSAGLLQLCVRDVAPLHRCSCDCSCCLCCCRFGGDQSWRNGTAMQWHYWTQPLPNPLSPYMHRMPFWMHRMETYATFVHETLCACFVFAPIYLRIFAFIGFESLMAVINLTGNYAQIGAHTINESFLLLNDNVYNFCFDLFSFIPGVNLTRRFLLHAHGPSYTDLAFRSHGVLYSKDSGIEFNDVALGILPWLLLVLPYALTHLIPLIGTFHGHNALEMLGPHYSVRPLAWYARWLSCDFYQKRVGPVWNRVWTGMETIYMLGRDFDVFGNYVKFTHMTKYRNESK